LANLWKSIWRRHLKPWRQITLAGVNVHYKTHLDGGGSTFGQNFYPFLKGRGMPKQARIFEWCAGPGFIGFSLLGHGVAETVCLADINDLAVAACRRTIADNRLANCVSVYHSDNLKGIPESERWDLVVSNPPHYADAHSGELRSFDRDWHIHREFFGNVRRFIKPGGVIVLQENNQGSTVETFRGMIEEAGLRIVFTHDALPERTPGYQFYYIGIIRAGDASPVWTR
jgi:methylase of polypeptide subunit release factors